MGIPDHLTCLLRNLYAGQEATVRTGHGTADWFQIGKGVRQGCILSPCVFNFYAEYIMRNAGLEEAPAGIKIAGRIIIVLCACVLSHICLFVTLWTVAQKAPLSMGIPGRNTGVGCHSLLQLISQPRDPPHVSYVSCIRRWILYH